jgi:hypothetical protein
MKTFTSIIKVEFAYNTMRANTQEEYIQLLKDKYLRQYDIELHNSEITQIEENDYV